MTQHKLDTEQSLESIIASLANHPRLLVAMDFDGTISDFAEHHDDATLLPQAKTALRILTELPETEVAVISGRSLYDLRKRFSSSEKIRLVGSHGHEFDLNEVAPLASEQIEALQKATNIIQRVTSSIEGSSIEKKTHGVVFHYRGALTPVSQNVINSLKRQLDGLGIGVLREGSMVLEYCVVSTNKGNALARIQEQIAPTCTLFIGDDVTDEAAFEYMGDSGISIKVGPGDTAAQYRINSPSEVAQLLIDLSQRRNEWIHHTPARQIDEHFFLSDLRTCALVDPGGSICWMCIPRIDGAPLFGSLVGGPGSGYFRIDIGADSSQRYIDNTLVVESRNKKISLIDFFDCGEGRTFQRSGRSDFVRLIEGTGEISIEFAPKYDFGRVPTRIFQIENGLRVECGQQRAVLLSPGIQWRIVKESIHDVAYAEHILNNDRISCVLLLGTSSNKAPQRNLSQMYEDTARFWELWLKALKLPKKHTSLAARSALLLRGLSYGPSGAIAAAATTSLPETLGGVRNWDYRYCWPRDAALAATALTRLHGTGPGTRLLDWLINIVMDSQEQSFIAPLYTVSGKDVPSEAEIASAIGYKGSRPVRIGNLAAAQLQLDTLAPIAELMKTLSDKGVSLTEEHLRLAELLVSYVASRWTEPDSGIWEVRSEQRYFVHSKLMCWYTVHNCLRIAESLGIVRSDWKMLADTIRNDIEDKGFDAELGTYVAAYDLKEPDAALLWIILTDFHPPTHPRCISTVEYVISKLVADGNVYRYHYNDALIGGEGEFIICRCWLIEALAKMGRMEEAQSYLDELISRIGPAGLLSEEWDAKQNIALGNYPQAYSHLGLINAICSLET